MTVPELYFLKSYTAILNFEGTGCVFPLGCSRWHVSIALAVIAAFPAAGDCNVLIFVRSRCTRVSAWKCINSQQQPTVVTRKVTNCGGPRRMCTRGSAERGLWAITQTSCRVNNRSENTEQDKRFPAQETAGETVHANRSLIQLFAHQHVFLQFPSFKCCLSHSLLISLW